MPRTDKRVDAYIAKSRDFAQPILRHIRATIHEACPECEETLKWGMPSFMYHGMLASMAAFKEHVSFGFWKAKLVVPGGDQGDAMGQFGRIRTVKDLPPKRTLAGYVKKAMALNEEGVRVPRVTKKRAEIPMPDDFASALKKNRAARSTFDGFSPSQRREYLQWITEAKTDATRAKRMTQSLEWLAEGKRRNWKYERTGG